MPSRRRSFPGLRQREILGGAIEFLWDAPGFRELARESPPALPFDNNDMAGCVAERLRPQKFQTGILGTGQKQYTMLYRLNAEASRVSKRKAAPRMRSGFPVLA